MEKFLKKYDAHPDKMFQKAWQSQKAVMRIYVPYMKLQNVDAEVTVK